MAKGYGATKAGGILKEMEYDLGALGDREVEVRVEFCGICHSDLSMLDNSWGMTSYPFVPGHEIIGIVQSIGDHVQGIEVGSRVGIGWYAGSCMTCEWCHGGDHNLCPSAKGILMDRHGGFADFVRVDATWAIPLPKNMPIESAGPLFCGGITVFNPMIQCNIQATDRVGVIGIGGLGHMALKFLNAMGCEVTAFSSTPEKEEEAKKLGAHHFVSSKDSSSFKKMASSLDFILSTVNIALDWNGYLDMLRPKGRLHLVGGVLEPLSIPAFSLLSGQKSISGSPLGSPATIKKMLDFSLRHKIEPLVEIFPFQEVNLALEKLRRGEARYRIVLKH